MSQKIAMIGAGSVVFCKTLIADILATPALRDSEFALMSPHRNEAPPHGGLRRADDPRQRPAGGRLGDHRSSRGDP